MKRVVPMRAASMKRPWETIVIHVTNRPVTLRLRQSASLLKKVIAFVWRIDLWFSARR
jgi:hypothetical protein